MNAPDAVPLAGRVVALTRPRARLEPLVSAFSAAGAETILLPTFRLEPVAGDARTTLIERLRSVVESGPGWLVFTSASAVPAVATLLARDADLAERCAGRVSLAAVGEGTADAITSGGLANDDRPLALVGDGSGARGLVEALLAIDPRPRVLHVTSDRGLPAVVDAVRAAGGEAERAVAVTHVAEPGLDPTRAFADPPAELITFASPSAAEHLLVACDAGTADRLRALPAVAIGATTAAALVDLGWTTVIRAKDPTPAATVAAAIAHFDADGAD